MTLNNNNNNSKKIGLISSKGRSQNLQRDEAFQKEPTMNKTFEKNSGGGRLTYNGPVKARAGSHIAKDIRYKT